MKEIVVEDGNEGVVIEGKNGSNGKGTEKA